MDRLLRQRVAGGDTPSIEKKKRTEQETLEQLIKHSDLFKDKLHTLKGVKATINVKANGTQVS